MNVSKKKIDLLEKNSEVIGYCDSMIDISTRSITALIERMCSMAECVDESVREIDEYQNHLAENRAELLKRQERSRRIANNFRKLLEIDEPESTEEQA